MNIRDSPAHPLQTISTKGAGFSPFPRDPAEVLSTTQMRQVSGEVARHHGGRFDVRPGSCFENRRLRRLRRLVVAPVLCANFQSFCSSLFSKGMTFSKAFEVSLVRTQGCLAVVYPFDQGRGHAAKL